MSLTRAPNVGDLISRSIKVVSHNPARRNGQHSESSAVTATCLPTRSPTPKPEVALPGLTHHQPQSPCSLSEARGSRLPHPALFHITIRPPQPGSIQAIIREQCRSRLYVPPIAWTSNQPRLLGCRFVFKQPQVRGQKQDDAGNKNATQQPQERLVAATRLARPGMASWRKVAVGELLEAFNIRPLGYV